MVELGEKEYEYNYDFGKFAADIADYILLVNKKHTEPIRKALEDKNYPKDKMEVFDTFIEAIEKAKRIEKGEKEKYILIENDLPDNY